MSGNYPVALRILLPDVGISKAFQYGLELGWFIVQEGTDVRDEVPAQGLQIVFPDQLLALVTGQHAQPDVLAGVVRGPAVAELQNLDVLVRGAGGQPSL